jgi:2,3-diketo-5-methylthiopentyl-1-phosphate enolase
MFVDPITTPLPETLDPERFIIATYYAAGRAPT